MCAGPFHPIVRWLVQAGKVYRGAVILPLQFALYRARNVALRSTRLKEPSRFHPEESRAPSTAWHHRALKMPPTFWPCLPDPNGPVSPGAQMLYQELEKGADWLGIKKF
jgi:hypothetical protein